MEGVTATGAVRRWFKTADHGDPEKKTDLDSVGPYIDSTVSLTVMGRPY